MWRLQNASATLGSASYVASAWSNVTATVEVVFRNPNSPGTPGSGGDVTAVAFLASFGPQGRAGVVSAHRDGGVFLWDWTTGSVLSTLMEAAAGTQVGRLAQT